MHGYSENRLLLKNHRYNEISRLTTHHNKEQASLYTFPRHGCLSSSGSPVRDANARYAISSDSWRKRLRKFTIMQLDDAPDTGLVGHE